MPKFDHPIYVTEPDLPPLESVLPHLETLWKSKILTNNGAYHVQLEEKLREFLGVPYLNLFSNGTLALLLGLKALRMTGEVITTPFSFVATTHSLHWNGITPVFCDIEEQTFNLDVTKAESLITNQTTGILPVHVYGNPCRVEEIQRIADIYGLRVLYDAAHAFGVTVDGKSILRHGDMSILSFHATKVFQTFEGGAIVHGDEKLKQRIDYLKNFGFAGETSVVSVGINAKMNEFQAIMGLLQMERFRGEVDRRRAVAARYRENLSGLDGVRVLGDLPKVSHNHSYFPILIDPAIFGADRDAVYDRLKTNNVYSRRYFYPLISHFPPYRELPSAAPGRLPVAERVVKQVLCLPMYGNLSLPHVDAICEMIVSMKNRKNA